MSDSPPGTDFASIAILAVSSAIITWGALRFQEYRNAATAVVAQKSSRVLTPRAVSAPFAPPVTVSGPPPTVSPAPNPPLDTSPQGQRQDAKITRGLETEPGGGIHVVSVPAHGIAAQLRLEVGDVVISVNGEPVSSPEDFARIYREQGMPRQLTVMHKGRETHRH